MFQEIHQDSGVKQGDPSSMALFILAYDPILRWISAQLSPYDAALFGMCDDLAIATTNVPESCKILENIFYLVQRFASLKLNAAKTQIVFARDEDVLAAARGLLNGSFGLKRSSFNDYLKYLGVHIGPGAAKVQWSDITKGFREIIGFIRGLNSGLTSSLVLYNVLAHSKFSYVASFVSPDKEVMQLEEWGLQTITKGPWQALPSELLRNLKLIGLPIQAHSLRYSSPASMARNSTKTLANYDSLVTFYDDLSRADDFRFGTYGREWIKTGCFFSIRESHLLLRSHGIDYMRYANKDDMQRRLYCDISDIAPNKVADILTRRLSRFAPADCLTETVDLIIGTYSALVKSFKPNFVVSHLGALCKQWCTSRRFQTVIKPCPFCGCASGDSIEHCLECHDFQDVFHRYFCRSEAYSSTLEVITFGRCGTHTPSESSYYLLYAHIVFLTYNSCCYGQTLGRRVLVRELKTCAEHCCRMCRYIAEQWRRAETAEEAGAHRYVN